MENNFWTNPIKWVNDIHDEFQKLSKRKYNIDFLLAGRKFPAKLKTTLHNTSRYEPKHIELYVGFVIHDNVRNFSIKINNKELLALRKMYNFQNANDILGLFNIYEPTEDTKKFEELVANAEILQKETGKQMVCNSFAIDLYLKEYNLSMFDYSSCCIIESELEDSKDGRKGYGINYQQHCTQFPFVRVFSMMYKKYLYVHISDLEEYKYNTEAFKKLFLPQDIKSILQKVFSHSSNNMYGDIINRKHGGLIIMAEGNPGTGKTSTAEVFSELNKKPLYIIQVDELGVLLTNIEENLNKIFRRVERWNAIVLLDEADVFLTKRDNDINRSAIVGVFLRMMDYFRGTLFLTTNRSSVIDHAVLSRITLNISYPDIDQESRKLIWNSKLQDANITIDNIDKLSSYKINGREIRNIVRLAKIFFESEVKEEELIALMKKTLPVENIAELIEQY